MRRFLWWLLLLGGCSASEPLPETLADCEAELQTLRGQIETRKGELAAAESLLQKTVEERRTRAGDPDSDAKTARLNELEAAEAELGEKVEGLRAELGRLEGRVRELDAHRRELAAAEAQASRARAEEEAEAKRRSEEEARRRAEEEARKKEEEAARLKAEEEAQKRSAEEARIRAEAEAQRRLEEEKRRKVEAWGRAEALILEGTSLFRQVQEAMKDPPKEPGSVRLLLGKIEKALETLDQAKAANAALRGESADPARIDERLQKIDLLMGVLRGHRETLKK